MGDFQAVSFRSTTVPINENEVGPEMEVLSRSAAAPFLEGPT
jgi:hypothetical protein